MVRWLVGWLVGWLAFDGHESGATTGLIVLRHVLLGASDMNAQSTTVLSSRRHCSKNLRGLCQRHRHTDSDVDVEGHSK
jgi:hypothetical protein